jgi:hypothetical protein
VQPGTRVAPGGLLGRVHARTSEEAEEGTRRLKTAIRIGRGEPDLLPLIVTRMGPDGVLTVP